MSAATADWLKSAGRFLLPKKKTWNWRKTVIAVGSSWWTVAVTVLLLSAGIAVFFWYVYDRLDEYWKGVATNTTAGFFDVVVVVFTFGAYEQFRRRSDDIARLRGRIEDVKRFDDPRAHSIIGSAIRGLAKFGLTDIDLRGARLTNFSFPSNGIRSISGAVISDGLYFDDEMKNFAKLNSVAFTGVDCSDVCFSSGEFSLATFNDCVFQGASLVGARFNGTSLNWSVERVIADEADWQELVDEAEDGSPIYAQIYNPAFYGADLTNCIFKKVRFQNADFRGAQNIEKAIFVGATGLETCHFDDGQTPASSKS
ncbi:hypothetical protein CK228_08805 [Mesorhizobium sp. WSM4312]|uniref:pentapeptide repeat-containing protein n=1 Tax=Mesorhizobium sp. WSM4312 TaxID=2029411 RepID=UPI000BAFCF39|nr:pentapeptide repeat-containing protein [Mesorhizobium sp. WSM4312]PBB69290.1 hypothetical protein CK228_08805 [Mesorhizobium sp. WSM4312]